MDLTDTITYFGSVSPDLVAKDFTREERQSFTVTREILWESESAPVAEVRAKELEFIRSLNANHPEVGYNRWPKLKKNHE